MQGVQDEHVKRRRNLLMLLMSEIVLKGNLKGKDKDRTKMGMGVREGGALHLELTSAILIAIASNTCEKSTVHR
jgi:hypothetical protein